MRDSIYRMAWCMISAAVIVLCIVGSTSTQAQHRAPAIGVAVIRLPEDAGETEDIQAAYDYDEVCRIITAEAGHDRELCYAVAQCLWNACSLNDWRTTPLETARMYQYAKPTAWASEEAVEAVAAIFDGGERYETVGGATLFYAPQYTDSAYHESNLLIAEIHGVRFFEEAEALP